MSTVADSLRDLLLAAASRIYPVGRAIARVVGFRLRVTDPRLIALIGAIKDPYEHPEAFEYAAGPDPWGYTTNPMERERYEAILAMLGDERVGPLAHVLEIGCAEGVFTQMLAPLCKSLLAVDFNEIAIKRARERCLSAKQVTFRIWNLRSDPIPGHFDLVVVMDILTYIRDPATLRHVIEKLVAALRPGDLMLASDYREGKSKENSWICRSLLFSAKWVIEALTSHPDLETLRKGSMEYHFFALLRKR